jgi:hypothetical protein
MRVLKANIISLGATLAKLLQIDGKTYTMKKDSNHKKKIGLLRPGHRKGISRISLRNQQHQVGELPRLSTRVN